MSSNKNKITTCMGVNKKHKFVWVAEAVIPGLERRRSRPLVRSWQLLPRRVQAHCVPWICRRNRMQHHNDHLGEGCIRHQWTVRRRDPRELHLDRHYREHRASIECLCRCGWRAEQRRTLGAPKITVFSPGSEEALVGIEAGPPFAGVVVQHLHPHPVRVGELEGW